jgi:hypothetical protein
MNDEGPSLSESLATKIFHLFNHPTSMLAKKASSMPVEVRFRQRASNFNGKKSTLAAWPIIEQTAWLHGSDLRRFPATCTY